ncbi:hypothetical protein CALVIDRAFT_527609 [Calocera viscosa TUFC12733]|uniref:Uncharacterized protein n=1 Tax=Calocera viscosa (strain TUFC12733) TaxID=1330018 RepID=A0A167LYK4_CALVF|nr:hypothetical protein CALVIDRAFT_527609 [Calocera viscosa TUFC12733]
MSLAAGFVGLILIFGVILFFALCAYGTVRRLRTRIRPEPARMSPRTLEALGITPVAVPLRTWQTPVWQLVGVVRQPEQEGDQPPSYQAARKDAVVPLPPQVPLRVLVRGVPPAYGIARRSQDDDAGCRRLRRIPDPGSTLGTLNRSRPPPTDFSQPRNLAIPHNLPPQRCHSDVSLGHTRPARCILLFFSASPRSYRMQPFPAWSHSHLQSSSGSLALASLSMQHSPSSPSRAFFFQ